VVNLWWGSKWEEKESCSNGVRHWLEALSRHVIDINELPLGWYTKLMHILHEAAFSTDRQSIPYWHYMTFNCSIHYSPITSKKNTYIFEPPFWDLGRTQIKSWTKFTLNYIAPNWTRISWSCSVKRLWLYHGERWLVNHARPTSQLQYNDVTVTCNAYETVQYWLAVICSNFKFLWSYYMIFASAVALIKFRRYALCVQIDIR